MHRRTLVIAVLLAAAVAASASARQWSSSQRQRQIEAAQAQRQREIEEAQARRQQEIEEANARRQQEMEEANARRQQEFEEANRRRQAEWEQAQEARRLERQKREQEAADLRKKAEAEQQEREASENEKQQTLSDALAKLKALEAQVGSDGQPIKLCAVLLDGFRYEAPYAGDLSNAKRVFEKGFDDDDVLPVVLHEGSWLKVQPPGWSAGWVPVARADVFPAMPGGYCVEGGLADGRYMTIRSGHYYRGPTKLFGFDRGSYKAEVFLEYPAGTSEWVGEGLFLKSWMPREDVVFVPSGGFPIAAQTRVSNLNVYASATTGAPTVFTIRDEGAYILVFEFVEATKMFRITPSDALRPGFVSALLVRDRRDWRVDLSPDGSAAHYLSQFMPPPPPPQRTVPQVASAPSATGFFAVLAALGVLYLLVRYRAAVWPVVRATVVGPAVFFYDLYDSRRREGTAPQRALITRKIGEPPTAGGVIGMASDDPPTKRGIDPLGIPQFEPRKNLVTNKLASLAHEKRVAAATRARQAHLEAQAQLLRAAKDLGVAHVDLKKTEEDYEHFNNPELREMRLQVRRLEIEAQKAELELKKFELSKKMQPPAGVREKASPLEERVRRRREIENDRERLCAEEDKRCKDGIITTDECEHFKKNIRDDAQAMLDRLP
jgi:hypothetical protein